MTKKQKRQLGTALLLAFAGLVAWILTFMHITPGAEASAFLVNQVEWTTNVAENINENFSLYLLLGLGLGSGYYFLRKKK